MWGRYFLGEYLYMLCNNTYELSWGDAGTKWQAEVVRAILILHLIVLVFYILTVFW